jgi:hypothetical protein
MTTTTVLAIVSALSAGACKREAIARPWIAELGLVGELWKAGSGVPASFNRRCRCALATACVAGRSWSWPFAATSATLRAKPIRQGPDHRR